MHVDIDLDALPRPVRVSGIAVGDTLRVCLSELAARDHWRVIQLPAGVIVLDERVRPAPWSPVQKQYHTLSMLVVEPPSSSPRRAR